MWDANPERGAALTFSCAGIAVDFSKQRIDAAEMFRKAGRTEQAEKEEAERALLEGYLPAGASEEEIDAAIAEAMAETGATSIKQMGAVMKAAQARLTGKTVDGKMMSDKVRSKLS